MVITVNQAFDTFLAEHVNLDPKETKVARNSREWLLTQIHSFPNKDIEFPKLYPGKDIPFGSFARRTKKRELDDIDIMIALHADGGCYQEFSDRIEVYVLNSSSRLLRFCFDDTNVLNSRKIINKFISSLDQIPQYEKATIKRNQEAATLNLSSYSWTFDLVPCFFTTQDLFGRDYYLIPDGQGNWKKTDPRLDRARTSRVNQSHNGKVLNVIRIMKYWNRRATMPSMSSYLIENMILDFYETQNSENTSEYVDLEIPRILIYLKDQVFYPVDDPKGIQGDINSLNYEDRNKISKRAYSDYLKALDARTLETEGNHKLSIEKWSEIFGSNFPTYG
jgi:hypothetical protein